jgi:hypothetical protein
MNVASFNLCSFFLACFPFSSKAKVWSLYFHTVGISLTTDTADSFPILEIRGAYPFRNSQLCSSYFSTATTSSVEQNKLNCINLSLVARCETRLSSVIYGLFASDPGRLVQAPHPDGGLGSGILDCSCLAQDRIQMSPYSLSPTTPSFATSDW